MFDRRGELLDGLFRVAVLDAFANAMVEVVFAGDVFVDHLVDRVDLPDDFAEPSVKIFGIHALAHNRPPGEKRFMQGA